MKDTYKQVVESLKTSIPQVTGMLAQAEPDLTALSAFPHEH